MAPGKHAKNAQTQPTNTTTTTKARGVRKTKEGRGGGVTGRGIGRGSGVRGGHAEATVGTRHSQRITHRPNKYGDFITDLVSQKNLADKKTISKKFSKANLKLVPSNLAAEDVEQLSDLDLDEEDEEITDAVGAKVKKPKKIVNQKIVAKSSNQDLEEDELENWDGNMNGTPYKRAMGTLRAEVQQNKENVEMLTTFCNKVVERHDDLENRVYSNGLALAATEKTLRMHSSKIVEHDNCIKKANENFAGLPGALKKVEENSNKEAARKVKNAEKRIGARQVADMELLCVNLSKDEIITEAQSFLKNKGMINDTLDMKERNHRRLLSRWFVSIKYEVREWDSNPLYIYEGGSWFVNNDNENSLSTYVIKLVSSGVRNELLNQSQDLGKDVFKVSHSWQDRSEFKRKDVLKNQKNEQNPGIEHVVRQKIPGFYEVVPKDNMLRFRTPPHTRRMRKKKEADEKKKQEAEAAARLAAAAPVQGAQGATTEAVSNPASNQVPGPGPDLDDSINMEPPTSPNIVCTNQNSVKNSVEMLEAAKLALTTNGPNLMASGTKSQ